MGLARPPERKIIRIADGVMAEEIDRRSILPPTLDVLLARIRTIARRDFALRGPRAQCRDDSAVKTHAYQAWVNGVYAGLELRLTRCLFCGAVEVRDISIDVLPGLSAGRSGSRRRSVILGWYSGQRTAGREYR